MLLLPALLPVLAGCPVFQSQDTPVNQFELTDPAAGSDYWLYVPSYYSPQRRWPLVITLHGTYLFDSPSAQIREWKALAEQEGFIVAAPRLRSVQGILPTLAPLWHRDLERDEQTIIDCLRDVRRRYHIHPRGVLLTGFSAGGYPLYYIGLRHPELFTGLAARACNNSDWILENTPVTPALRAMPILIIWGRNDLPPIASQSWSAYRWLRDHQCMRAEAHKIEGGHLRIPDAAWQRWTRHLPAELQQPYREGVAGNR